MHYLNLRRTTLLSAGCVAMLIGLAVGRKWHNFEIWHSMPGAFMFLCSWRYRRLALFGVLLLGIGAGAWRGSVIMQKLMIYEDLYGKQITIQAQATTDGTYSPITRNLGFDGGNLKLTEPFDRPLPGLMKFEVRGVPAVYRGDTFEIRGKLFPAGGSKQGSVKFASASLVGRHRTPLETTRLRFVAAMQTVLPEPLASFGLGILVGQRSTLPKDVSTQLSIVGLTHIIAVSGYNLTIIVQFVGKKLGKRSKFQVTFLSGLLIGAFILVTGFSASIVRAGIVSMLSLSAWYYGRAFKPVALLLLSAVITAAWNPVYLWSDIGWWLSFLAFFGVLVMAPLISQFLWHGNSPKLLMPLIIESASAQIMAAPLIMYIFQETSLISLLSNVLIVPLVPLAMLLLLIAGLGGMVLGAIAAWVAWPAKLLTGYMLEVVQLLARVPHARIKWPINLSILIVIYSLVVASCWLVWFKLRVFGDKITEENELIEE